MVMTEQRLLYTIGEAAERLSLSRAVIYRLVARGELRPVHVGRSVRLTADELTRYVERLAEQAG